MCDYEYNSEEIAQSAQKFWVDGGAQIEVDDIRECIRRAYKDLTVRTMTKKSNPEVDDLATTDVDLYEAVCAWMNGSADADFDAWHQMACIGVIAHLKKKYEDKDCTVGKAQKIVNMTFKNLYALFATRGADVGRFAECHLPLDSFTLEWVYRTFKKKGIAKTHIASWSAITEYGYCSKTKTLWEKETDTKTYHYTYFFLQDKIRSYFKGQNITPLQAEFIIWPNIQFEMAAEGFYAQLLKNMGEKQQKEENASFKEQKTIQEKKNTIKEFLLKE